MHAFLENSRISATRIQIVTLVPGESNRELIKTNKTIARFPRVRKRVFFIPGAVDNIVYDTAFQRMCVPYTAWQQGGAGLTEPAPGVQAYR